MDKDELWNQALSLLLENTSEDDPKNVFLHLLVPLNIFGDQYILIAQNSQVESWVTKNYLDDIREAVAKVSGRALNIGISSKTAIEGSSSQSQAQPQAQPQPQPEAAVAQPWATTTPVTAPWAEAAQPAQEDAVPDWMNTYVNPAELAPAPKPRQKSPQEVARANVLSAEENELRERCTFDTFVVGQSNEFARGAALAVAEQPGVAYNPLFIYGKSGLGKTHLLLSIANYINRNMPYLTTLYVPADTFITEYINGIEQHDMREFNQKYYTVDVLLIDDIQRLENRDETTNELFKVFNEMTANNKQIVLAADRSPKDINLDERMRSRFVSGLLADIKPPDYETRLAIIKKLIKREEEHSPFYAIIPEDVQRWLAEVPVPTIRDIQGAITKLVGHMSFGKKTSLTLDEAKEVLQDFFPDRAKKQVSISAIQSEVERFFTVTHEDLVSSKRSKSITYPRHIAIYLSRYMTEESLQTIGKKFGGRDHTTVMHSVTKIEKDMKDNKVLFDQLEQLRTRINERV